MSRREPVDGAMRPGRARAYLRRFFTSWVATDPDPEYSALDRHDGLGQLPDPMCTPRPPLPESPEVAEQQSGQRGDQVAGRTAGRGRG